MSHSVYNQVNEQCTSESIKSLLRNIQDRSAKAKSEIHISGTKDDLIRNLGIAVDNRYATLAEINQLLWDSEEVGKQHILLLRPAPEDLASPSHKVDIATGSQVATALFGDSSLSEIFPRYGYPSRGYVWSDFRLMENGGWLGKAYGREVYRQSQGIVSTEEVGDGVIQEIRQYSWKEVKTTLVANWRPSPGILELRIDISNLQTEKTIDERRNELWTLLKPAFDKSDLIGVDIDGLLERIIFDRETPSNRARYSISRVELTDPRSGQIRVIPKSSESLDHDPGRKASLEAMKKNNFRPSLVRVEWKCDLPDCPKEMTEPVSVVIEKTSNGPELRILKRINSATYEYIFNQLRSRL